PDENDRKAVLSTAYWLAGLLAVVGLTLAAGFSAPLGKLVLNSAGNGRLFLVAFTTLVVALIVELDLLYLWLNYKSMLFNAVSLVSLVLGVGLNVLFIVVFHWGVFGIMMTSLVTRLIIAFPCTTFG